MGAFPSRRSKGRALLATAGVAVLAVVAGACSSNSSSPSGAAATGGTPVAGGTATYALPPSTVPNYIFPFDSSTYFSVVNAEYFQYLMYRPLYWFGNGASPTLNTSLSVAEAPQYTGNQVTIHLKGWKWSNGETVTANNVLFWIHMMQAVASTDWGAFVPGGFPTNVSNVRAVNATEVQMTMNKAYNPQWFTYNELSQITPMPEAWDRTASGPSHCTTTVSDCAAVYSYLDSQSKNLSGWASSPIWSVVDGPWKLSAFNSDGNSTFVPNTAYSGPQKARLAKFEEVPFTTENAEYNVLQAGATGGQKIDVGYLPTTDAPPKPSNATVGHNPVNGYTLDPLYSWSINYFPLNYQSTTGNGPIIKQLYFREALQLMMNQAAVISGPLHGYGQFTVGPVGTYPPNPYLSSQGKAGDPFPYNPTMAKQLLTSNGWTVVPNGVTTCTDPAKCGAGIKQGQGLSFTLPYATGTTWIEQEMTQLQSNASQIGIKLSLDPRPFNQVTALAAGNCVVAHISCNWDMGNWGGGWTFVPDYYPSGETLFLSGSGANSGGYTNAQNDSMINATLTTASTGPLDSWQDFLAKQVPVVWQPNGVYELTEITSNLRGVIPQSTTLNLNPENWYFVNGS
ncbi:MAG TPA: ABC transporter substrate-binding protein [Trebonia sp.]|jgi:peptide/nickel transport system substrate-binding protein|nr:ABC transporter substrate-binding protein [Trebonia sp.]